MNSDSLIFSVQWILMVQNKSPHYRLFLPSCLWAVWLQALPILYLQDNRLHAGDAQALGNSRIVLVAFLYIYKYSASPWVEGGLSVSGPLASVFFFFFTGKGPVLLVCLTQWLLLPWLPCLHRSDYLDGYGSCSLECTGKGLSESPSLFHHEAHSLPGPTILCVHKKHFVTLPPCTSDALGRVVGFRKMIDRVFCRPRFLRWGLNC